MSPSSNKEQKSLFEQFLHSQTSGSLVLILAAAAALIWANSPWADLYVALNHSAVGIRFGTDLLYKLDFDHLIKDGLMTVFFFVVGLEIKREVVLGELSSLRKASLPVIAAIGGAVVPALFYLALNPEGEASRGWGVPMATDIAFALGLLALFGSRVPIGLKVFLTALAIADDMLAVLVIAGFYTEQINWIALGCAAVFLTLIGVGTRIRVSQMWIYLLLMLGVWLSMFASGVHATTAGVLIALMVPMYSRKDPKAFLAELHKELKTWEGCEVSRESMARNAAQRRAMLRIHTEARYVLPPGLYFESTLHTFQAFVVLPLFALFATGVVIDAATLADFPSPVGLGIILGLVLGKQIGILLFSWLTVRSGAAELPAGVSWFHLWGASALAGIGFTMSIFVSELAFTDDATIAEAKIAIFIASFAAAVCGWLLLNKTLPEKR